MSTSGQELAAGAGGGEATDESPSVAKEGDSSQSASERSEEIPSQYTPPVVIEHCSVEEEEGEGGPETKFQASEDPLSDTLSDPELDELLDLSLSEFGKHIPTPAKKNVPDLPPRPKPQQEAKEDDLPPSDIPPLPGMQEFEEIFSDGFATQAEVQLNEAMQMLQSENPELWQQFEVFAKSMGLEEHGVHPHASGTSHSQSTGQQGSSVDSRGSATGGADPSSLDAKLEETVRRLRESTEQIEQLGELPPGLSEALGGVSLEGEEGEEGLMKVMEGMMTSLLSKDVLYPSLNDLCGQYPDWLSSHKETLSAEDYARYCKQLEIMMAICQEFEGEGEGERAEEKQARFDRVLQLMQQLQEQGQPPTDLAGETFQPPGLPASIPGLSDLQGTQNCVVM